MQSITLCSHVGEDGILQLQLPVGVSNVDLKVTVTVQPVTIDLSPETPQGKGWPPGFFEETFGCFQDDPLVIDTEGVKEDGEELA